MPELPEVETVVNTLKPIVIGKKIKSIEILRKSIIQGDLSSFSSLLENKEFLSITRIGKFIIFHLSDNLVFWWQSE